MATWVRCTDKHGQSICLNIENATMVVPIPEQAEKTEVIFIGSGSTRVRESPDQIIAQRD